MPEKYIFLTKDKRIRAENAVIAKGGDVENEDEVMEEYEKMGGAWRDAPAEQPHDLPASKKRKTKKVTQKSVKRGRKRK